MPLALALAAGLVAACGQTKMLKTWKSPELQTGSIRKMLVVGVFNTAGVREAVEGQFVEQLRQERLEAVASHAYLADDELGREAVVQRVRELAFDGVVLARILDRKTYETYYAPGKEQVDVPVGYYDEWYKEYVESQHQRDAVGYTDASRIDARVETRLFDARTQKLVWTGVSETAIDGRDVRQVQDAVGAILKSMRSSGVF
jgi:hypothetical protein